ncbi:MAG TPA: hypothetical protein VM840_13115 [Actinomycetota bacterium]|nr:hypothetical protein [Actinomycetota bacterium]
MRDVRHLFVALALVLSSGGAAAAEETTRCTAGGPTPGFRAIRLDLREQGSNHIGLEIRGTRSRPVGSSESWHLVQGVFVLDAVTREPVAWRVHSRGSHPHRTVVRTDGQTHLSQAAPGPDVPLARGRMKIPPGLAPGVYDVVAFGTDGSRSAPQDQWLVDIRVQGKHRCTPIGSGEVIDVSHADAEGGTQVVAPGAGYAEGVQFGFGTGRETFVGVLDASVYSQGEIEVAYELPDVAGTAGRGLLPLVSRRAGDHRYSADYRGLFPVVKVAGVAIDLPPLS